MNATFHFDTPIDREGSCCLKWDRRKGKFQEEDILPLWIADTDFPCPPEVIKAIEHRCAHPVLGYSFAAEDYYTSIIHWFKTRHDLTIQREWMRPACGVVTSLSYGIQTLTKPGDKVLIQTPVYDPFHAIAEGTGRTVVESPLRPVGNSYAMDFTDLESQFRGGVRLMLLCNPHNPVGRVWTAGELKQLVELCVKYHVYLISDEIHCDFALFGNHYTSILAFPEIHPLAICCIAPGKTFNVSGLSVSTTLVPDSTLNQRLLDQLRTAWLINPNVLGLVASAAAYTHGGDWMDAQLRYLEENSALVQKRLREEAPHIVPARHEGTFLMWLNFRDFGLANDALHNELVHTWHLGMNDGWHFGSGGDGFMRMNIGCRRELLNRALDQLAQMHRAHFPQF